MMLIFVFIAFVLQKSASQSPNQCLQISEYDNTTAPQPLLQIESASVFLEKSSPSQPQYSYNITLKSTTITSKFYQVAVGLSYIQNFFDPNKLDFLIKPSLFGSSFSIIFTINPNASWTAVHIHYVATSRDDIRANTFQVLSSQIQKSSDPSQKTNNTYLTYNFNSKKATVAPYTYAQGFISGLRSNDRFADVRIQGVDILQSTNQLNFTMTINSKSVVDNLWLSYIVYTTDNANPIAVSIMGSQNLFALERQSFVLHLEDQFIGVFGLNSKELMKFFTNGTGNIAGYSAKTIASIASRAAGMVPLEQTDLQSFSTSFSPRGFTFHSKKTLQVPTNNNGVLNYAICVNYSSCLNMGGVYLNVNGQYICVICKAYSTFSNVSNMCECNYGYVRDKSQNCVPITNNNNVAGKATTPIIAVASTKNSCINNFTYDTITKSCICKPPLFSYTSQTNVKKCVAACTGNLTFDIASQKCICQSNQYNNNICVNCKDDLADWNSKTKKCECQSNSMRINGGNCQSCSEFADFDSLMKVCVCWDGYLGDGVTCDALNC